MTGVLNARKGKVSDGLEAVAETVRRLGEPLREEPFSKLGGYTNDAARSIERVAVNLRERDVDQLAEDLRGFARRQPAVFVGAGLAAGLVAARFLKSSGERTAAGEGGAEGAGQRQAEGGGRRQAAGPGRGMSRPPRT